MPKTRISNDRGLVQNAGDGVQIVSKNGTPAGLHFKCLKFDFKNLTGSAQDNAVIKDLGVTLPNQSQVLFVSSVVTEISSGVNSNKITLAAGASGGVVGNSSGITNGQDLLTGVTTGTDGGNTVLNHASGSFLAENAGIELGTNTSLYILEDGTNGSVEESFVTGSVTFTIGYVGIESV